MNKFEIIKNDQAHESRSKPKSKKFDNNYLYYLYAKGSVNGNYYNAREYLHEHYKQIVSACQPLVSKKQYMHIREDMLMEMYLLIDSLYIKIFEDDSEVKIKSEDGQISYGNRFQKYYQPKQVYGYIRVYVYNKIIDYLKVENTLSEKHCNEDFYVESITTTEEIEEIQSKVELDYYLGVILNNLLANPDISDLDKTVFIQIWMKNKSVNAVAMELDCSKTKINYSKYRIIEYIQENIDLSNILKKNDS